jgi:hypothetical protein
MQFNHDTKHETLTIKGVYGKFIRVKLEEVQK